MVRGTPLILEDPWLSTGIYLAGLQPAGEKTKNYKTLARVMGYGTIKVEGV